MNKLTKAQEKRFDEKFPKGWIKIKLEGWPKKEVVPRGQAKQHLADELEREREKIIKIIEKGS